MGFGFSWSGGVTYNGSSPTDPARRVIKATTGSGSLKPGNVLRAQDPDRRARVAARESGRILRQAGLSGADESRLNPYNQVHRRLSMTDYGPVNLPTGGVTPDPLGLGNVAVMEGSDKAAEKINTYLTADEIEAQKLADAQAAADAEAARVAGQEMLMRRRRARDAGLLASGFGSLSSDYKTVLGV